MQILVTSLHFRSLNLRNPFMYLLLFLNFMWKGKFSPSFYNHFSICKYLRFCFSLKAVVIHSIQYDQSFIHRVAVHNIFTFYRFNDKIMLLGFLETWRALVGVYLVVDVFLLNLLPQRL